MKIPLPRVIRFSRPRTLRAAMHLFSDFLFVLSFLLAVPVMLLLMTSRITNGKLVRLVFSPDEVLPRYDEKDEESP